MRIRVIALIAVLGVILTRANATAAENPQQQRMKTCNAEATQKALKGDARKTFMQTCLSGGSALGNPQQEKMKSCNTDASAKGLRGSERQAFMKTCLSGK